MYIYNPNSSLRAHLLNDFPKDISHDEALCFLENIFHLKQENPDLYTFFISALYPIFYLGNLDSPLSDDDEEDVYDLDALDGFNSINDVCYYIDENPNMIFDLILCNRQFQKCDELEKRFFLLKYSKYDQYLSKISKFWLLDKIEFTREITKDEFLQKFMEEYGDEDFQITVCEATVFMRNLALIDINCFDLLLNSIFIDSYNYYDYKNIKSDKILGCVYGWVDENTSINPMQAINDMDLLFEIVDGFFNYSLLSKAEKDVIERVGSKRNIL